MASTGTQPKWSATSAETRDFNRPAYRSATFAFGVAQSTAIFLLEYSAGSIRLSMEIAMNFPTHTRIALSNVLSLVVAVASANSLSPLSGDDAVQPPIAYPNGFREWVHVKSGVIGPEFPMEPERGVHHIYANKAALAGVESGTFEDGSVLVYDLVSLNEKGGVGTEGPRRRIDVMVKDNKLYAGSGGWGFARFMADDQAHDVLTADIRKTCLQCHEKQKAHGFVFSQFRR